MAGAECSGPAEMGLLAVPRPDVLPLAIDIAAMRGAVANIRQPVLELSFLHKLGRYHQVALRVDEAPLVAQLHARFSLGEAVGCPAPVQAEKARPDGKLTFGGDIPPGAAPFHRRQSQGKRQRRDKARRNLKLSCLVYVTPALLHFHRRQSLGKFSAALELKWNHRLAPEVNEPAVAAAENPGQALAERARQVVLGGYDRLSLGVQIPPPRFTPKSAALLAEVVQVLVVVGGKPRPAVVDKTPTRPNGNRGQALMEGAGIVEAGANDKLAAAVNVTSFGVLPVAYPGGG